VLAGVYAGWSGSLEREVVEQRLEGALRDLVSLSPRDFARTWIPSLFSENAAPGAVEDSLCRSCPASTRPVW